MRATPGCHFYWRQSGEAFIHFALAAHLDRQTLPRPFSSRTLLIFFLLLSLLFRPILSRSSIRLSLRIIWTIPIFLESRGGRRLMESPGTAISLRELCHTPFKHRRKIALVFALV